MKRLLVPGAAAGVARVTGAAFHHLAHVLRARPDERLEVFDGRGQAFAGRVVALEPDAALLELDAGRLEAAPRPIAVVQSLVRAEKLELVLQKGTELGASAFFPAVAHRSVVKADGKEEKKTARWQRIVEEAARQCGRADVPLVHPPARLDRCLALLAPGTRVFVLDEDERSTTLSAAAAPHLATEAPFAVVVGPEGGLERAEVSELVAAGAVTVTLGRLVLRTETAALAALAVLRHLDGHLG